MILYWMNDDKIDCGTKLIGTLFSNEQVVLHALLYRYGIAR